MGGGEKRVEVGGELKSGSDRAGSQGGGDTGEEHVIHLGAACGRHPGHQETHAQCTGKRGQDDQRESARRPRGTQHEGCECSQRGPSRGAHRAGSGQRVDEHQLEHGSGETERCADQSSHDDARNA